MNHENNTEVVVIRRLQFVLKWIVETYTCFIDNWENRGYVYELQTFRLKRTPYRHDRYFGRNSDKKFRTKSNFIKGDEIASVFAASYSMITICIKIGIKYF